MNWSMQEHDRTLVTFLKRRQDMIGINVDHIKTEIKLTDFGSNDSMLTLLFALIILKNANSLIIELGNFCFMNFLRD